MMRIAAREADIVSFIPQMTAGGRPRIREATTEATAAKVSRVREAAGRRFERLELSSWVAHVNVADARAPLSAIGAGMEQLVAALVDTPYVLAGTRGAIRDKVLRLRDRLGITYWTIPIDAMEDFAPVAQALAGR
jgi:hypothetical protein